MPNVRKLKLHIGLPKTGSSSIQSFLNLNSEKLYEQGIFLPKPFDETGPQTSLVAYAAVAKGLNFSPFIKSAYNIHTEDDVEPFKADFLKRFDDCLDGHEGKTVVFTSELFFSELKKPEQFKALKALLESRFSKIEVIAYMRSQESWVGSRMSQTVKLGSIIDMDHLIKSRLNNYYRALEPWWNAFGKENLHLRVLEREKLVGNDLIIDFLHLIEAENAPDFVMPERQNPALSSDAIEYLQSFNKYMPFFLEDSSVNPLRQGLTQCMEDYSESNPRHQLTQAQIEAIRKRCGASNEKLRKEFFPTHKTLFKHSDAPVDEVEVVESESQSRISAYLWSHQKQKIIQMKQKIDHLELNLQTRIENIERGEIKLNDKVGVLQAEGLSVLSQLTALKSGTERRDAVLDEQISSLQEDGLNAKDQLKALGGADEDLAKELSDLKSAIESRDATLDEQISSLQKEGLSAKDQLDALGGADKNLAKELSTQKIANKRRVADVDDQISSLQEDGLNARSELKTLGSADEDLAQKISSLKSASEELEKKILALEKQNVFDLLRKKKKPD